MKYGSLFLRVLLLPLLLAAPLSAADLTVKIYGSVTAAELTTAAAEQGMAAAKTWFDTNQPDIYRTLHVGTVTMSVLPGNVPVMEQALALSASTQALVSPVLQRVGAAYQVIGWRAKKLTTYYTGPGGTTASQTLFTATGLADALPITSAEAELMVYRIQGTQVQSVMLSDGLLLPTAADAANVRWMTPRKNLKGTLNGTWLAGAGANLVPLAMSQTSALSSYPGAWVQFLEPTTGEYRYLQQSQMTHLDPQLYDPVALNNDLILGGTYTFGITPTPGTYNLDGTSIQVTFDMTQAKLITGLPDDLYARANGTETPRLPTGRVPVNTTQNRGEMPLADSTGQPTGQKAEFYAGGQGAQQSSQTLLDDVLAQNANSRSAAPVDTAGGEDRINTPVTTSGSSGLSQREAMEQSRNIDYRAASTNGGTALKVDYGTDPVTGQPQQETIAGGGFLSHQDLDLNQQVATRYDDAGNPIEAQVKPLVIDATGTTAEAAVQGQKEDIYAAADIVNAQLAPHFEGTQWTAKPRGVHHGALIYPIDIYDDWGIARWGDKTGNTVPDLGGVNTPGDGDNPMRPLPLGIDAGHPFYDFDDDGDLDRFWSDDPFDGGYKRVRVMWAVVDGVRRLGDFQFSPANNVLVTGIKKPKKLPDGSFAVEEDVLFHLGWNHKPFHHRKFNWKKASYVTYYTGSLITPLDPYDAADHGLYQLALRNTVVRATEEDGQDGVDPEALIPTTASSFTEEWVDANNDTIKTDDERRYRRQTVSFYPGLADFLDPAEGNWTWSDTDFTLSSAITDQPGIAARVTEVVEDFAGNVLVNRTVTRPWDYEVPGDPSTTKILFDTAQIPVRTPSTAPTTPVADRYMWDYPRGRSTAQGGSEIADPDSWRFPWNVAWKNDEHSRRHSAKAFQLNSANLNYFPEQYRSMMPKLTHDGLLESRAEGGEMKIQMLLRENPDLNQPGDKTLAQWRDGFPRYTEASWMPGREWWESGRAPFHVFGWDADTDMHPNTLSNNGIRMPTGNRVYEVEATSMAEYVFRGQKLQAHTRAEQIALLRRMWNYFFFGKEYPASMERCMPSLCIPQRYDQADLRSTALNRASVPQAESEADYIAAGGSRNRAGDLGGALTDELNDPNGLNARHRDATKRRARLIQEQVFIFSAGRGREWEMEMARRMPRSVKLVCVEWEDKNLVKSILGRDNANIVFPETTTTYKKGALGEKIAVTVSSELDLLRSLALDWFDGKVVNLGYADGRMGTNTTYRPTGSNNSTVTDGVNAVGSTSDCFVAKLREGLPAAKAYYAYQLRSRPMAQERQWSPDPGQAMQQDVLIEFRHPMLVLYHDRASSVYVHYGRNCDPDEVFGAWDDCAVPLENLNVESPEFRRRQAFEAWRTQPRLEDIYNRLHPEGYQAWLASQVEIPPAPENPGAEPTPPQPPSQRPETVIDPGPAPMVPLDPIWTRTRTDWGSIRGGTTNGDITKLPDWAQIYPRPTDLQQGHDAWLAQFPDGGRITGVTPQSTTTTNYNLSPNRATNVTYLTTSPGSRRINLTTAVRTVPTGNSYYPGTFADTGEPVTVHVYKRRYWVPRPGNWVTETDWDCSVTETNWGIDPDGGWAFAMGNNRLALNGSISGAYPEILGTDPYPWDSVFGDRTGATISFHLDTPTEVTMSGFSYDDGQFSVDGTLLARYNGDRSRGAQVDRSWTMTLPEGDHTFTGYADNNSSNRGVRGIMIRIVNQRNLAKAIADADLAAFRQYQTTLGQWQEGRARYDLYLRSYEQWVQDEARYGDEQARYEALHAQWVVRKAAYDAWFAENQALLALKEQGQQFYEARQAWVQLVNAECQPTGVSWSGDPSVTLSTLPEIRGINPQLPIWEAYGFVIDPVNGFVDFL